jgi:crotonobetainyl-CoA:carnitine CoA-transferase CaiB-like acyl-CoA transferase
VKPDYLKGIRVLDFTRVLAGPYATRIFADFGAEVIKVQPLKDTPVAEKNQSPYFRTWNRNKRSITLNMKHPASIGLIKQLVRICDVVVENFSPRVMDHWGLGFEELQKERADLIMLRMSGFGQTGPWKDFVAYAPTVHALGGLTYMTAESEDTPLGPGFAYGDIISGLFGAYAVLAALENRRQTGRGDCIDLSEYEVICSLMGSTLLETAIKGISPIPNGNRGCDDAAPIGCFKCKGEDRWCVLSVENESQWAALCRIINPALAQDKRFSTPARRKVNFREIDIQIETWTRNQTPQNAVRILQAAGVPSGVVQNAQEVAIDPQHSARRFFTGKVAADGVHPIRSDVTPLLTDRDGPVEWNDAPSPGEANRYVCQELLGLSEIEYLGLIQDGVMD